MAVAPVKYKHDSSTEALRNQGGVAGGEVAINQSTANPVQKDVKQGFTETLDGGQERQLNKFVNEDDIEYTTDESKNVGTQQLDTKGKDGEELKDKNSGGSAVGASAATVGAVGAFAVAALTLSTKTKALAAGADGFTQAVLGGIALGLAASTVVASALFDPNKDERKNQTGQAEANNTIINNYYDTLNTDMDAMTEESTRYGDLVAMQSESDINTIDQIAGLQSEIQTYQAQGNTEKVAELQKQIKDIQKGAEGDTGKKDEMGTIKESLETYYNNNSEAQGVKDSGDQIAEFLRDGYPMKTVADINMYALFACGLATAATLCFPKLAPFFPDLPGATAAKIMTGVAALLFIGAAGIMKKTSGIEADAGAAGSVMADNLGNLAGNIEANAGYTETTVGEYDTADAKASEEKTKAQAEADKKLAESAQQAPSGGENRVNPLLSNPETGAGGQDDSGSGEEEAA